MGEGRGFCSGLDAEVLRQTTAAGESRPAERAEARADADPPGMFSYLPLISKPVISAVNGVAAGGGFVLAMMSDLRFGSDNASFTTVFSKRGLIAEHGTSWVLPRLVGPSRALDLLWSSRRVTADEALRIGLLGPRRPGGRAAGDGGRLCRTTWPRSVSPSAIAVMKSQVWRHLSEPMLPALADADRLTQAQLEAPGRLRGRDVADRAPRAELPALDRRALMSAAASDVATVLYEKNGPAATITLNRPEARNGIVPQLMDELWDGGAGRRRRQAPCACWCCAAPAATSAQAPT